MRNTKKGFTIVELVIVIAIIAILAAVLIPTFSNIIKKANESASLQEAKTKFNELYAIDYADGKFDGKNANVSFIDDNNKVTLDGYESCEYNPTGTEYNFSYKDDKYECKTKLGITSTGSQWSVEPIS